MKKSLKILRIVLIVGLVLVLGVVILVRLFADRALKIAIETAGTSALRVGVRVEKVDLSILAGKIGFRNLVIDNPSGYKHEHLLVLNDIRISVNTRSLLSDTVRVRDIRLDGMELVIEQKGLTTNNLQEIMKSLPSKKKQQTEEPSGKRVIVDNLEISNVVVKVKLLSVVPGKFDTIPLKLKPIKMANLGSDQKVDTRMLIGKVFVAIAEGISEQGLGILPDNIVGPMINELKRVKKLPDAFIKGGEKLLKGSTDIGGDVLKEGKDIGKDITEGLKGLLGGKKEQDPN